MTSKPVKQRFWGKRVSELIVLGAAVCVLLPTPARSVDLGKGDFQLSWDTTLSWGLSWRLEDPDPSIIGLANGGTAYSVNGDDGNLNYRKGMAVSNTFKLTTELELRYHNFGGFFRYRGFKDFANEDDDRERTQLSDEALNRVGSRSDVLDAFIWAKFDLGSKPAEIRVGEQVVSWGESTFIQGGINAINPVDVSAIRVPGAELREALSPEGLVWTSFSLTANTSLELLYLYDWDDTEIDPPGSYFSTNDFAGDGGRFVFLGFGTPSSLGPYPPGASRERPFLGVPRDPDGLPDDSGQYGLAFRFFAPGLHDTEFGLYYLTYHSRLPIVNGRTGTLAGAIGAATIGGAAPTIIGTTLVAGLDAGIAAGLAAGVPLPVAIGIAGTALTQGPAAAGALASGYATDAYAQTAAYFLSYPEDIELFGLSFNTSLGDFAVQGEVSYRPDMPLQVDDLEILFATLGPISAGLAALNQVGNYTGQFETPVVGYRELDVWQFQTTVTKAFGPSLGADQAILVWEGAYHQVNDMPDQDVLRFEGPGTYTSGHPLLGPVSHPGKPIETSDHFATSNSWGYRLAGRLDYNNAIGAFNLSPRFSWQHDVSGITPGPGGSFLEGRKALTLGIRGTYQNTWEIDLSYTAYSGADRWNLINDRDFLATNVKYSF